jgi:hypothetical protein
MQMDGDIMGRVHRGEITPGEGFALQALRPEPPRPIMPSAQTSGPLAHIATRYATARTDILANGPDILQDLLTGVELQIERMGAAWSECERNSRRREIVTAWETTQGSKPL